MRSLVCRVACGPGAILGGTSVWWTRGTAAFATMRRARFVTYVEEGSLNALFIENDFRYIESVTAGFKKIDSVRASRDGHEFHETWAARLALRLLMPIDDFVGIAMEGLAAEDLASASAATVQIADATLYYGKRPLFKYASNVNIVQVKYSVGKASQPFRATDAKNTIEKFAASYLHHKATNGAKHVRDKLTFELVTNQKIATAFEEAVRALSSGKPAKGDAKKQAEQFTMASGLSMEFIFIIGES